MILYFNVLEGGSIGPKPKLTKKCEQAVCYCRTDIICLFWQNEHLPACLQSSTECTLSCACAAQHAFLAHSGCARMTDSCVHVRDDVIPHQPIKRPKNEHLGRS